MIKIVGMGVIDGDVSIRGAVAIDDAEVVIVKSAMTATYGFFKDYPNHLTCDALYDKAGNFGELDSLIASYVLQFKDKKTVFCVDGSGVDDRAVAMISSLCKVEIICGVSRETFVIKECPTTQHVVLSAYDLSENRQFDYDSELTLVIKDIDNSLIATEVKEALSRIVGDEREVIMISGGLVTTMPVYEIDQQKAYDYSVEILVEGHNLTAKERYNYIDLMKIMDILRGDNGCKWDKAQTHASIRSNVIEEAYELVDAINNDDIDNIIEEAGDVLLQAVFHAVIGDDEGEFQAYEVIDGLCRKLLTRHTHIFGGEVANTHDEALNAWDAAKAKEKGYAKVSSKMDSIAKALPSLVQSRKALKIGGKWGLRARKIDDCEHGVLSAIRVFVRDADKEAAAGELLLSVVNLLNFCDIDGELALNSSTQRFINRFKYIECISLGKTGSDMTAEELKSIWLQAETNA